MNGIGYVVIITETSKEADAINESVVRSPQNKIEAFPVFTGLRGIRFGATRPTMVIEKYSVTGEKVDKWRRECLLHVGGKDTLFI